MQSNKIFIEGKTDNYYAWMDVLRGLLIISVVIGHSTGKFNEYIYQFHMGAFFIVSGYLAKQKSRTLLETMYHKVLTLLLPVITSICILQFITYVLYRFDLYNIFFADMQYNNFSTVLKEFFANGSIYVWWLGAAWFVLVLFQINILHRLLYQLLDENYGVSYAIVSIGLFFIGYSISETTWSHKWNFDLVLIAQFYYAIGLYLRQYAEKIVQKITWMRSVFLACVTFAVMHNIATKLHFTMDYPSRAFNTPAIDALMVLNGALFMFAIAMCINKVPFISKIVAYLGRNTLPILLFHFMAFKVPFYILYKLDIINFQEISAFVPSSEIGNSYWWFITLISILVSLLIWVIITHIPATNVLFGQNNKLYKLWYSKLSKNIVWSKVNEKVSKVKLPSVDIKSNQFIIMCLIAMVLISIPIVIAKSVGNTLATANIDYGIYQDGWVEPDSSLTLQSGNQGIIHISGWYGSQALVGDEVISIYCNGSLAKDYSLTSENIEIDILCEPNTVINLEIKTNFSFQPEPPDIRELAFVLNDIVAE